METQIISIIVPVYNIAPYLPRCLDSILAQTHENLEVILVDDGSTDESGGILDAYAAKDPRIRVIHQANGGVTRARFSGLRAAKGEWIGFVDGDDYIEPDMYRHLLDNAQKYDARISHCGYRMVFPNRVDSYYNTGLLAQQEYPAGLKDLLDGTRIEPGLWNKLFHKTLLHSLFHSGVEDMGIRINEDLLMNFYLFRAADRAVYEDFCPYHYVVRKNSAANSKHLHHLTDPIRVAERICRELGPDSGAYPEALRLYARKLIAAAEQIAYVSAADEAREKLRKLCWGEAARLPRKERWMVRMVVYARPVYRLVRRGYEWVTRVNHKYDLE